MRLIDQIEGSYSKVPLRHIGVPEWGASVKLYFRPLTGEELDAIQMEVPDGASSTRQNAQCIVLKALDSSGKRCFSSDDVDRLMQNAFVETITRIAVAMSKNTSVEDAEKNSVPVPNSGTGMS